MYINIYSIRDNLVDQNALIEEIKNVRANKKFFEVSEVFKDIDYRVVYREKQIFFRVRSKKYGLADYQLSSDGAIGDYEN